MKKEKTMKKKETLAHHEEEEPTFRDMMSDEIMTTF